MKNLCVLPLYAVKDLYIYILVDHAASGEREGLYNIHVHKYRWTVIIGLFLWVGFVFSAFYIVQKPLAIQVSAGLLYILRTLAVTAALLFTAGALGGWALRRLLPSLDPGERFFLGTGLGLGLLGLLGFGLAAFQLAHPLAYLALLVVLLTLAFTGGRPRRWLEDLRQVSLSLCESAGPGLKWVPWAAGLGAILSLLLAFAPPAESFDALLYHLALPAAWLRDGGLAWSPILPHAWFPGLVEGIFAWGLALGSESTAPLLHWSFGLLTAGLVWWWARKAWNASLAWRSLAVMISMPSLFLLAAWAYTDLALAFYSLAALFAAWRAHSSGEKQSWVLAGACAGLAMGVKYTSFILPLLLLAWQILSEWRRPRELWRDGLRFILPAVLVAAPWYLRNWIWTGNPFYPFLFGGKGWDAFLDAHYAAAGTGIGWNALQMLLLPLNITLGQHDANFYDGRIGPLWLVLLPAALWLLWRNRKSPGGRALTLPAVFGLASLAVWTVGIINTSALWQSRLLFPALLPLAPLAALAWEALTSLDTPRFKFSFIFNVLAVLCIAVNLLDFGVFVLSRNPLAAAVGITRRQTYFEQIQPNYADALKLVDQTPPGSEIYFLFEPRSYGMSRRVTPDAINANLAHDLWLHHTPEAVLQAWQTQGYDYLLYQKAGDTLVQDPLAAEQLFSRLTLISETPNTILYKMP